MALVRISDGVPVADGALAANVRVPLSGPGRPTATVGQIAKLLEPTAGVTFPAGETAQAGVNDGALHFFTAALDPVPAGITYLDAAGNALTAAAKFDIAQKEIVNVGNPPVATHRWRRLLRLAELAGFSLGYEEARLDVAAQAVLTDGTGGGVSSFSAFAEASSMAADWLTVAAHPNQASGSRATITEAGEYFFGFDDAWESTAGGTNNRVSVKIDLRLLDSSGTVKRHLARDDHYFRGPVIHAYPTAGTGTWQFTAQAGPITVAANDALELNVQAGGSSGDGCRRNANRGRIWIKRQTVTAVAA